jgi:hypothetical protein
MYWSSGFSQVEKIFITTTDGYIGSVFWSLSILILIAYILFIKYLNNTNIEPKPGILTSDEILKFTPYSRAAKTIRWERKGGLGVFLKHYKMLFIISIIISCLVAYASLLLFIPFLVVGAVLSWAYNDFLKLKITKD